MSNVTSQTRQGFKTMNASATPIRVGLIVPSSTATIETELPALLARHESAIDAETAIRRHRFAHCGPHRQKHQRLRDGPERDRPLGARLLDFVGAGQSGQPDDPAHFCART